MSRGASRFSWRPEELHGLPVERARARISAYVYGNILVLAAVLSSSPASVRNGHALVYVLATTATTYLAHVLAHDVASTLGRGPEFDRALHQRAELRDALPILSSGSVPALMMLLGAVTDWRPALLEVVAAAVITLRLAGMGALVARLNGLLQGDVRGPEPATALWSGVVLATLCVIIVGLKVWLLH